MRRSCISLVEKNIYGDIGIRQYYYYTKKQAMALYRQDCRKEAMLTNQH